MRRGRHHSRIGGLCRHPVDAGEMKAADAARLVAACAGHVVEPALEAAGRADVLQLDAVRGYLLQGRDDVSLTERGALALHEAEFRLQVRWIEACRCRRNRAIGEKL